MRPLVEPEPGAPLGDLYRFLNTGDDGKKLVVGWALMALGGTGPYPILSLHGEEGSAKTSMAKLIRGLIDDNGSPVRALPREERDLLVSATHSHVLCFDNVSGIDGDTSDRLCRISTGGGMSVRQMYTNADEHVVYVRAGPSSPFLAMRAQAVRGNGSQAEFFSGLTLSTASTANELTQLSKSAFSEKRSLDAWTLRPGKCPSSSA